MAGSIFVSPYVTVACAETKGAVNAMIAARERSVMITKLCLGKVTFNLVAD